MEISNEYKPISSAATGTVNAAGKQDQKPQPSGESTAANNNAPVPREAVLAETLKQYGYTPDKENLQMLSQMLEAGIPLTKENVAVMYRAQRMTGDENLERAIFLFENDIPVTAKNMEMLSKLLDGQAKITTQLNNLMESISQLRDPQLKEALLNILNGAGNTPASGNTTAQGGAPAPNLTLNANIPQTTAQPAAAAEAGALPPQTVAEQPLQGQTSLTPQTPSAQTAQTGSITEASAAVPQNSGNTAQAAQAQPDNPAQTQQASPASTPSSSTQLNITEESILSAKTETAIVAELAELTESAESTEPAESTGREAAQRAETAATSTKMSFPLRGSSPQKLEQFINDLREALVTARETIAAASEGSQSAPSETARVLRDIQALTEQMDFTAQIKEHIYMQIPIESERQTYNTTLFINKKNKGRNKGAAAKSAFISLDTASLGLFEAYIQKDGEAVNCRFTLENEQSERLTRENVHRLNELLQEHGYRLESFTTGVSEKSEGILGISVKKTPSHDLKPDTALNILA